MKHLFRTIALAIAFVALVARMGHAQISWSGGGSAFPLTANVSGANYQIQNLGGLSSMGPTSITGNQTNGGDQISHVNVNNVVNVQTFGAVPDGLSLANFDGVSISSGSATLTCTGCTFTNADVGKTMVVYGAGASGAPLVTTINSVSSDTIVALATIASTTVASANAIYGTNNQAAIQNAENFAYDHGSSGACLPVYFPAGMGRYLTGPIQWLGCTNFGAPGAGSTSGDTVYINGESVIEGLPGDDIFAAPDVDISVTRKPYEQWTLKDLTFYLDDSENNAATFTPARLPGRIINDASISAGSNVLTSTNAQWQYGDVGQVVLVVGGGAASCAPLNTGTNCLSTTITGLVSTQTQATPITQVTLGASATTAVASGGTVYIAVANLSATSEIGNCVLAYPESDGNQSDWKSASGTTLPYNELFQNLTLRTVNASMTTGACGLYFQGSFSPYQSRFQNVYLYGFQFGLVGSNSPNTNVSSSCGTFGDLIKFDHGEIDAKYPWITYGGAYNSIDQLDIEAQGGVGIQVLPNFTNGGTCSSVNQWMIDIPQFEQESQLGHRISGSGMMVVRSNLAGASVTAEWDAQNSTCENCQIGSGSGAATLDIGGGSNLLGLTPISPSPTINDYLGDSRIFTQNVVNPVNGRPTWMPLPISPLKQTAFGQAWAPDFLIHGVPSASYPSDSNLWFWPQEMGFCAGCASGLPPPPVIADSTSESGYYVKETSAYTSVLASVNGTSLTLGTNFPAVKGRFYVKAKCPTGASYTFAWESGGYVPQTLVCSTSYTTQSFDFNAGAYAAGTLNIGIIAPSGGEVDVAWIMFRPWNGDELVTGNATVGGDLALGSTPTVVSNATGTLKASALDNSAWGAPGAIGGTTPNTGAFSALTVGGNSIIASGHGFIPFATGQLAAIVASGQYFAGETPVALSLQNFVATAAALTCTTNPTLTLEDCGTSAGTCTSPTPLASVTLTAANTITSSATTFPVAVAQGHFLAVETTAGACTLLNATGSAAY